MDMKNKIEGVLINGEPPLMTEKSVDIPDSVETSKRIVNYLEEVKPLLIEKKATTKQPRR